MWDIPNIPKINEVYEANFLKIYFFYKINTVKLNIY